MYKKIYIKTIDRHGDCDVVRPNVIAMTIDRSMMMVIIAMTIIIIIN